MKIIYFADLMGDIEEEALTIEKKLKRNEVKNFKIHTFEDPSFFERKFDVLFFDYGGMCFGNDLLGSFCREIVEHAKEHPSRIYVMNSEFTKEAMRDILELNLEVESLANIYLTMEAALPYIKIMDKEQ